MRIDRPRSPHNPAPGGGIFSRAITEIRRYRAAEFEPAVTDLIHAVANNPEVSEKVVSKIKAEAPAAHKLLSNRVAAANIAAILAVFTPEIIPRIGTQVCIMALIAAITYILHGVGEWRERFRDYYVVSHLIRALEYGLIYQDSLAGTGNFPDSGSPEDLRDNFAASIQRAATRFPVAYKRSGPVGSFFKRILSRKAIQCQNDMLSLIPGLVTATSAEVGRINDDLARVLIRTQLGYWYQTGDIARQEVMIPLRYQIRLGIESFAKDRAIHVAVIAFLATLTSAILLFIPHP